jgi:hypothetical protein
MLSVVMAAAALIALLAFAPFASAASDPLASGTTTLTLNQSFFNKLKKNGVKVVRVKKGTVDGRTVTMRVTGGSLDPATGQGTIVVNGGLKFQRGKAAIPFRNLTFDTTKNALNGKAGKKKMKLATLSGLTATRDGFGVDVSLKSLKLTSGAAKQVNKQLGFDKGGASASSSGSSGPLKGGQVMGGATSTTQPSTVTLTAAGNAVLIPDPVTFGVKFPAHGVNPLTGITPIAPATEVAGPAFIFPIAGGTLAPDASAGTVNSAGGIKIKSSVNTNTVQFDNLSLDFSLKTVLADNTVNGVLTGRSSIADVDMSKATVTSDSSAKTITVAGAVVKLQSVAAALLNTEFPLVAPGTDFAAGDSLGTVQFTAHTQ